MRKVFFLVFSTLLLYQISVRGQSEAQVSQHMFCVESYNPSIIANTNNAINLIGLYRQQWIGIPNAPQTAFFAANGSLGSFFNKKQGIGIAFVNDKLGVFSNQSVNLQYALRFKLNDNYLSVGTNVGFVSQTIAGDSIQKHLVQSDYHDMAGDLVIPTQSVNAVALDFGLGLMYTSKDYYAGLSVLHLFQPVLNLDDYLKTFIGRTAFITGGYDFPLNNIRYIFKPSLLVKTDFISLQTDLSARIEKDQKYWVGLSWRYQDAVVFFAGINLMNGLSVSCSYDLPTSKIIAYSIGSPEIVLRYSINLGKNKLNKYKSVRVL